MAVVMAMDALDGSTELVAYVDRASTKKIANKVHLIGIAISARP